MGLYTIKIINQKISELKDTCAAQKKKLRIKKTTLLTIEIACNESYSFALRESFLFSHSNFMYINILCTIEHNVHIYRKVYLNRHTKQTETINHRWFSFSFYTLLRRKMKGFAFSINKTRGCVTLFLANPIAICSYSAHDSVFTCTRARFSKKHFYSINFTLTKKKKPAEIRSIYKSIWWLNAGF